MPSVTVRIPDSLRLNGYIPDPINTHAKARLMAILTREDLTLGEAPLREVSVHANFWLNAADAARLTEMGQARQVPMSLGEVITTLLVEDAQREQKAAADTKPPKTTPPKELSAALKALGLKPREEQTLFYRAIAPITALDSPAEHKVLFAEAGTGTGKTLAYLVSAHRFAQSGQTKVGIAIPTHALIDKVLKDWDQLCAALKAPVGTTLALLGQAEFISLTALEAILSEVRDESVRKAIEVWIAKGGPAPDNGVLTQRWTRAGLRSAAPDFELLDSVRLEQRDDDFDPGFLAYKGQWAAIAEARVVFMTHAMLASLTWRRRMADYREGKDSPAIREAIATWEAVPRAEREGRLHETLNAILALSDNSPGQALIPNLDLLIVDEAHQLDDAFALVLSQSVSMWALRRDIQALHAAQPRTVKRDDVDALEGLWRTLRNMKGAGADAAKVGDDCFEVVTSLANVLARISERKRPRDVEPMKWRRINALSNSLQMALKAREKSSSRVVEVMVRWSPDRAWPQLTIGRLSYAREMDFLWQAIAQRTCLVSGTLYEEIPQLSCEAIRRALNVPYDSMLTMEPVHAQWQYTPVTVCMIGAISTAGGRPRYIRPRVEGESTEVSFPVGLDQHADWARDVASYILQAHSEGKGGMLVLGTAFKDLSAIAGLIGDQARVLEHRPGHSLGALREQFLALAENDPDVRPILLAAGSAWTGFDLHLEGNPNACTDLVILNAPFGAVSRTLAREARLQQRYGFNELVAQVTVLVRQGIGRLVRSPETPPNRRIHWLDARIHQPTTAGMLNPVKRVFAKYKQITVG